MSEQVRTEVEKSLADKGLPPYIVWGGFREWKVCGSLVQALEWRGKTGWLIYEPMGMTTAVKVTTEHELLAAVRSTLTSLSQHPTYEIPPIVIRDIVERLNELNQRLNRP